MSQYLLLRDNKQSGPYSAEDLLTKGFKPYDLIWVEGKSAGWRYPGELPEFKSIVPMVEEQPFDRFYKKPESETAGRSAAAPQPVPQKVATLPQSAPHTMGSAKVFVTLPESMAARETEKAVASASTRQHERYLPDESPAARPEQLQVAEKPAAHNPEIHTSFLSQIPDETLYQKAKTPKKFRAFDNRSLLMAAVALCLVLGGIIIGLLISGKRQTLAPQRAADQLVKDTHDQSGRAIPVSGVTPFTPAGGSESPAAQASSALPDQPVSEKTSPPVTEAPVLSEKNGAGNRVANKPKQAEPPITASQEKPAETDAAANSIVQAPVTRQPGQVREAVHRNDSPASSEKLRASLLDQVNLQGSDYKVGLLGGISNLAITVENKSEYALDQVEVLVKYLGPEKKLVKQQTVFINNVAPGTQKTISVPKSGRGVSASWNIVRINSKALGMAASF